MIRALFRRICLLNLKQLYSFEPGLMFIKRISGKAIATESMRDNRELTKISSTSEEGQEVNIEDIRRGSATEVPMAKLLLAYSKNASLSDVSS
ncbi:Hypothetical predicted protein [Octopus vulgaris]|uniref:Uncharacterized protein n=1 Tax=Octopus vulgaris TaxID=6645 RepID=A0AA36BIP5_OCTVU|nr:Hypothetical predicted protein [Octopus vulgaris]